MQPSLFVLGACIVFVGSHLVLSASGLREMLTPKLGSRGFTLLFTIVTLIAMTYLIVVVAIYGGEGRTGFTTSSIPVLLWIFGVVSGIGGILMVAGLLNYPSSPMAFLARRMREKSASKSTLLAPPSVIDWVTRHPFFVGLGILAMAHVFLANTLATAIYFFGLAALPFIGIPLQDRKLHKRWPVEYGAYQSQTSVIPFTAARGREVVRGDLAWKKWTLSVLIAAVFLGLLHPVWTYANGAILALFILFFGTAGVAAGLRKRKKR